jgi:hypothetical protein
MVGKASQIAGDEGSYKNRFFEEVRPPVGCVFQVTVA